MRRAAHAGHSGREIDLDARGRLRRRSPERESGELPPRGARGEVFAR